MVNMIIESAARILKAEDKQQQKFAWHAEGDREEKERERKERSRLTLYRTAKKSDFTSVWRPTTHTPPSFQWDKRHVLTICMHKTNEYTHTHSLVYSPYYLFLCFTIFMLFVRISHTKQPQRWAMHLINEENSPAPPFMSEWGVLLIRLSK